MRYHWGLGVGHLHAHQHASTFNRAPEDNIQNDGSLQYEAGEMLDDAIDDITRIQDFGDAEEDPDWEEWEDESEDEEGSESESESEDTDSEEEDFTGM